MIVALRTGRSAGFRRDCHSDVGVDATTAAPVPPA
jgi:hypothetical protein